jgi:hypothetical protein
VLIIFPADPLAPTLIDDSFRVELEEAVKQGFETAFVSLEALEQGNITLYANVPGKRVLRTQDSPVVAMYRGWILKPKVYAHLFEQLLTWNIRLVGSPAAYECAHNLPSWYERLKGQTARSVWWEGSAEKCANDLDVISTWLRTHFREGAVVLKDYLKSQKHYWHEACFIPDVTDSAHVAAVARRFIELQGDTLVGGLVFREYLPFKRCGVHPRSKFPLAHEWRAFLWKGQVIHLTKMWPNEDYHTYPLDALSELTRNVMDLPFVAVDVAQLDDDKWKVVEINDGGIASFPEERQRDDSAMFYWVLKAILDSDPLKTTSPR